MAKVGGQIEVYHILKISVTNIYGIIIVQQLTYLIFLNK